MMPIAGRPFLDYVLSAAADAGLDRIAIVVAPDHDELRRYYEITSPPASVRVDFVVQAEPRGTADAVLAAERWIEDDPFLAMNGDNLYPVPDLSALRELREPGLLGFDPDDLVRSGNVPADRVRAFALVEQDADGLDEVRTGDADLLPARRLADVRSDGTDRRRRENRATRIRTRHRRAGRACRASCSAPTAGWGAV